MSRDDDVRKTLGSWLGKAKSIGTPPAPGDAPGMLKRAERGGSAASDGELTQLNFKIPQSMKRRIKLLAARDSITLLVMLDRMLELYEREHGRLDTK